MHASLSTQPSDKEINQLLEGALKEHQNNQLPNAILKYQAILDIQPKHADALHLLGVAYLQQNQAKTALPFLQKACEISPQFTDAHYHHAMALETIGDFTKALTTIEYVLKLNPEKADYWFHHAIILRALSKNINAIHSYQNVLKFSPDNADIMLRIADIFKDLDQKEDALIYYQKFLSFHPDVIPIHLQCAHLFNLLGLFSDALKECDAVLKKEPNNVDALSRRATNLKELKQLDKAQESLEKALHIEPNNFVLLFNYANIFFAKQEYGKAQLYYERSLAISPEYTKALHNAGLNLKMLGQPEKAIIYYKKVLEKEPHLKETQHNLALAQLLLGNFKEGWANFEARWHFTDLDNIRPKTRQALWMGDFSLKGKTILLHAEQGMGDAIQFSRYVKDVAALGAKIILRVPAALYQLLKHTQGASLVITTKETLPDYDCYCPLMSLPFIFKTDLSSLAQQTQTAYLYNSPDLIDLWKNKLPTTSKLRVGVCWSGNPEFSEDALRSIPFKTFCKLFNNKEHIEFFSLQNKVRESDLPDLHQIRNTHAHFHHLGESLQDFTDTAAVIASLDLVISVDTAVAHLAAALGKACWILIAATPDWRWLLDREDSPWYPTVKLFRQTKLKEWEQVIERVKKHLIHDLKFSR
jgi:tetratricopeptide (TPR) repeat protein